MKITKFIPLAMLSVVLLASCQSRESKINKLVSSHLEQSLENPQNLKVLEIAEPDSAFGLNYFKKDEGHCNFFISSTLCNRVITEQEVENFLAGKKQILDGFCSKAGKHFSSLLSTTVEGKVMLNSTICQCPQCGGEIRVGPRAYNCSNYSNEDVKCQFSIWRTIDGHEVTPESSPSGEPSTAMR